METTLGKRIVAGRKKQGLTQDQLAERLGVTAQAVSKWENDQSCPDITMLPKLAEIFGTTTDALLGMEREPEPTVIQAEIVDSDDEDEGFHYNKGNVDVHFDFDGGRWGSLGFAIWVLVFGGLLLASTLRNWDVGWWGLCWPSCLLVAGAMTMIHKFSFMSLGVTLFGGYFLLGNIVPLSFNKGLVMPVLIVLFGLSLLVDAMRKPKNPHFVLTHNGNPGINKNTFTCSEDSFTCATSFGEGSRRVTLDRLASGQASVSFGELNVDLSGCKEFAPDCHLDLSCSFGELNLLVPRICRVVPNTQSSFAGVEIKGSPNEDAENIIHVKCGASFGEICVKYI